jgi:hypothetical protein
LAVLNAMVPCRKGVSRGIDDCEPHDDGNVKNDVVMMM